MSYATPQALRMALEDRLRNRSAETAVSLDRLRRRVIFERILARLEAAEPGRWVLKGGMALEVRLGDAARLTKDLDLGLRSEGTAARQVHEHVVEALSIHRDQDWFELAAAAPQLLRPDAAGGVTWRMSVSASLAGRSFGGIRLDVSPRAYELVDTERLTLPNSLDFAGIASTVVEIVDVNRHAAEKLHGMLRVFEDRENTRVRDLVDLALLAEHRLLVPDRLAAAVRLVWLERNCTVPPPGIQALPESWRIAYERLAAELGLETLMFVDAQSLVRNLWAQLDWSEAH